MRIGSFPFQGSVKSRVASDCLGSAAVSSLTSTTGPVTLQLSPKTNRRCGETPPSVLGKTALVNPPGHEEERLYKIVTLLGLGCTSLLTSAFEWPNVDNSAELRSQSSWMDSLRRSLSTQVVAVRRARSNAGWRRKSLQRSPHGWTVGDWPLGCSKRKSQRRRR